MFARVLHYIGMLDCDLISLLYGRPGGVGIKAESGPWYERTHDLQVRTRGWGHDFGVAALRTLNPVLNIGASWNTKGFGDVAASVDHLVGRSPSR